MPCHMQKDMLVVNPSKKTRIVHVETELGIVNIHLNLHNLKGRKVETVTFVPNQYAGEQKVVLRGNRFIQLKRKA